MYPTCQKCSTGSLVPLSDYGGQGSAVHYKAWVCTNPACDFNLKIRNGEIIRGEPIQKPQNGQNPRPARPVQDKTPYPAVDQRFTK
jgi:hypothetical protein